MTIAAKRRFDLARMFHPARIALSGTQTALGQAVLTNLQSLKFSGSIGSDTEPLEHADLALVADAAEDIEGALQTHAARGARAAIVLSHTGRLAELAKAAGIRVLGPHSYGLVLPGLGLNASHFGLIPGAGRVALIGQSAALARTIIDWAVPNAVGFSHIIGIGGNADIGFGVALDHLSRDPGTAAILLEIDHLRNPRAFYAAARAAARLRPVIAITPGMRLHDTGGSRAALEAGFARAGVLLTASMSEFLAAAETLTRVKPARNEALAIIANSAAAGQLAADAAIEAGIALARLGGETAQVLSLSLGLSPTAGPIYASTAPAHLAELAALLSAAPEIGGLLVVHTPSEGGDDTAIEALIACAKTVKIPLLIAAMGEARGHAHRHRLAGAGLACFATPEAAIAGFRHLLRNRRNRAAARELPASKVLAVTPDKALVATHIAAARLAGREMLVQDEALGILSAYKIPVIASRHAATARAAAAAASALGFPAVVKLSHPDMATNRMTGSVALDLPDATAVQDAVRAILARLKQQSAAAPPSEKPAFSAAAGFIVQQQAPRGTPLRIRVTDDSRLGPSIGFGAGGGDPQDCAGLAAELPPLNLALARALIRRAPVAAALGAHRGTAAADEEAIAATLVRVSQLIIDTPEILLLDLDPLFANAQGVVAASARLKLRPAGQTRPALMISPYPSELISQFEAKGQKFLLRPIRPEDADAQAALFSRFTAQDMRYRFFSAQRSLPAEQIIHMTDIDYAREMAIIAVRLATGETAGAARLVRSDTDGAQAEFAVGIEPAAKGLGLAAALMGAIIAWGRAQGVAEISGQILADNTPMLAFIKRLGFALHHIPDDPGLLEARLALA